MPWLPALAFHHRSDLFFECGQLILDDVPDQFGVHPEILMDENIAQPCDLLPIYLQML